MPGYQTRRDILKKSTYYLTAFLSMPFFSIKKAMAGKIGSTAGKMEQEMNLPRPSLKGSVSVEEAIKHRRTIRSYRLKPLTLEQLSQIFWAAQGITEDRGYKRSAPSAGGLISDHDKDVKRVMRINRSHEPLLILPLGYEA